MTRLLTAAQMRAIEAAAIASGAVTGLELMERAGRGVAEAIFAEWPELRNTPQRAVVLCGPGNNGGDGFVVARLLKERGWKVAVFLYGDPDALPPDAAAMKAAWLDIGGKVFVVRLPLRDNTPLPPRPESDDETGDHALVIDALFGTGLTRPIDEDSGLWRLFEGHFRDEALETGLTVHRVAIDVPSGLCADSGRVLSAPGKANVPPAFHADLTVAAGFMKVGHWLDDGPAHCGKVRVASLGWLGPDRLGNPGARNPAEDAARLFSPRDISRLATADRTGPHHLSKAGRGLRPSHKYTHGHALILSGPPGRGGAARLAARGALRIGAGLVTVGCPPVALAENAARLDAVMLRSVADAAALTAMLEDERINALCLGPGLGTGAREAALLAAALAARRPAVLDADALTILSRIPDLFAALHEGCVLTPHAGEFARLFPDIAERLAAPATKGPAYSKVDATREAAKRARCAVLFKGPDTVIADRSGRCSINSARYDRAAPWLATAGSGDVLAGFIAGLLARGFAPMQAAETGAWLHVECAREFGPGLIAEDLPDQLPAVFRDLGL